MITTANPNNPRAELQVSHFDGLSHDELAKAARRLARQNCKLKQALSTARNRLADVLRINRRLTGTPERHERTAPSRFAPVRCSCGGLKLAAHFKRLLEAERQRVAGTNTLSGTMPEK